MTYKLIFRLADLDLEGVRIFSEDRCRFVLLILSPVKWIGFGHMYMSDAN